MLVHAAVSQAGLDVRTKKKVVDPKASILAEGVSEIVPECVYSVIGIEVPDRIGPSLLGQSAVRVPDLYPKQRVIAPPLRLVDIQLSGHNIVVACKNHWDVQVEQSWA